MKAQLRAVDNRRKVTRLSATLFKRREGEDGFTLIETMIALFILVTALLGIISTTVVVINSNDLSKTMTTATTLAKDRMEVLKNTNYSSLVGGSETVDSIYTRTWTVTSDGTPVAGMRSIRVSVAWNWRGTNQTVNLDSIVAKE